MPGPVNVSSRIGANISMTGQRRVLHIKTP
jgi:hypothetical protein